MGQQLRISIQSPFPQLTLSEFLRAYCPAYVVVSLLASVPVFGAVGEVKVEAVQFGDEAFLAGEAFHGFGRPGGSIRPCWSGCIRPVGPVRSIRPCWPGCVLFAKAAGQNADEDDEGQGQLHIGALL